MPGDAAWQSSALERLSTKPAVKQPPRVVSKQARADGVRMARRSMACLISEQSALGVLRER